MQFFSLFCVCALCGVTALKIQIETAKPSKKGHAVSEKTGEIVPKFPQEISLRKWLGNGECFNMAIVPQYNNQHTLWGLLEVLREEGLLSNLTGISAVSGGTVPGAYLAAGKTYDDFQGAFPAKSWGGFATSEPQTSESYLDFLGGRSGSKPHALPKTFEELKVPYAITLTGWSSEEALMMSKKSEAHEIIASTGDLHQAMLAAVATAGNGAISDPWCPHCLIGMHPKTYEGAYPVTDGAFADIWGVKALPALPACNRLLHINPLDYAGQVAPRWNDEIPGHPTELVTVSMIQPAIATFGYQLDSYKRKDITKRTTEDWNAMMYAQNREKALSLLDEMIPMAVRDLEADASAHLLVDAEICATCTEEELAFNKWEEPRRDRFWKNFQDGKDGYNEDATASEREAVKAAVKFANNPMGKIMGNTIRASLNFARGHKDRGLIVSEAEGQQIMAGAYDQAPPGRG